MEFKLVYGNHGSDPIQIFDLLQLIKYSLEGLGHKADLEAFMTPGKTNIIIEFFTYDFLEVYKEFSRTPGTSFILIGTEFLTGDTFNQFEAWRDPASLGHSPLGDFDDTSHYSNLRYWRKRFRTFTIAAQLSQAVWHLGESQRDEYAHHFEHINVDYLPHGFVPELARVTHQMEAHKDIDVLFTGTPTEHRKRVFHALEDQGLNVMFTSPRSQALREDLTSRARLATNVRQSPDWRYPSNSRFHYHLTNSSLLVTERTEETCDLSKYVIEATAEDFVQACVDWVHSPIRQREAQDRLAAFREQMPMAPLMEALLECSFA